MRSAKSSHLSWILRPLRTTVSQQNDGGYRVVSFLGRASSDSFNLFDGQPDEAVI
jgi:hypothetical protein